jgi:hypothetical protein
LDKAYGREAEFSSMSAPLASPFGRAFARDAVGMDSEVSACVAWKSVVTDKFVT